MRRVIAGLFVAALVSAPRPVTAAAGETLSLEDAVHDALAHNERGQKAPLRITVAEGGLEKARDAFLPSVVFGASASLASKNTATASLTVTQPLIAPSAYPLYSSAKHTLYSERWGAEQDRRTLAFETARAFFQALAAEKLKQAAERRLATARSNLDNAEARAAAGLTSSNDVTRAQIAIASALSAVASAEATVSKTYVNLSFLTLRPIVTAVAPSDNIGTLALAYEPKEADIKAALDRRFDVKAAHAKTEALEASAREPLYRLWPSLSVSGSIRLDPTPSAPKPVEGVATLNLSWAVFDAGVRYADRKTRVAAASSAALDEASLRRSVEADVKIALASLKAARSAFKIADEAIAAAQRSVGETTTLYNQGLAKAIELTDANLTRFDAEVTRASARVTMEQAYLDLRQALGYGPLDA